MKHKQAAMAWVFQQMHFYLVFRVLLKSVFTHPHVVPNLYVFICSAERKGRYLEECFNQTDFIPH